MRALLVVLAACGPPDTSPRMPAVILPDAALVSYMEPDDADIDAPPDAAIDAPIDAPPDAAPVVVDVGPEIWLKGTTHVHAKPSGDSTKPIQDVIAWYETRGYDFIVLTDHNKASEIDGNTAGSPALRDNPGRMIVIAGIELTNNPSPCLPAGDSSGRCRIHVNLLGVTKRFSEKLEWANRHSEERVEKYQAAIDQQKQLGGVLQLNHPNWYWGMTAEVLVELANRGIHLVEIANAQFEKWNTGDKDHASTESLWDTALQQGMTLWGVASDDAHDYDGPGKYPPGGGWVVVKARRNAQSILDALEAGRFYSSNGVGLDKAELDGDALVVQVTKTDPGKHTIEFVENGRVVARVKGLKARRKLPETGYVRAVVVRGDGKKAWIQPFRRP